MASQTLTAPQSKEELKQILEKTQSLHSVAITWANAASDRPRSDREATTDNLKKYLGEFLEVAKPYYEKNPEEDAKLNIRGPLSAAILSAEQLQKFIELNRGIKANFPMYFYGWNRIEAFSTLSWALTSVFDPRTSFQIPSLRKGSSVTIPT